jgi:hypothetical protein
MQYMYPRYGIGIRLLAKFRLSMEGLNYHDLRRHSNSLRCCCPSTLKCYAASIASLRNYSIIYYKRFEPQIESHRAGSKQDTDMGVMEQTQSETRSKM